MQPLLGTDRVRIHHVYYDCGTDTDGFRRTIRAPFDLVKINGVPFIQMVGDVIPDGNFNRLASPVDDEYLRMYRDILGYCGPPIIVQEYEMGDVRQDNWKSKFKVERVPA